MLGSDILASSDLFDLVDFLDNFNLLELFKYKFIFSLGVTDGNFCLLIELINSCLTRIVVLYHSSSVYDVRQ